MAEVPHDWAAYARCQQQLSNRASLDDASWGLEAGLNAILVEKSEGRVCATGDVTRTVANASRRNRYDIALLRKYASDVVEVEAPCPVAALEARNILSKLSLLLSSENFRLLVQVGQGEDRAALAAQFGLKSEALRARISRVRSEARQLLAA